MFQASGADFLCESFSGAFVDKSALEFQRFGNALIKFVKLHWLVLVLLHETPWKQHAQTPCHQTVLRFFVVLYQLAISKPSRPTSGRPLLELTPKGTKLSSISEDPSNMTNGPSHSAW